MVFNGRGVPYVVGEYIADDPHSVGLFDHFVFRWVKATKLTWCVASATGVIGVMEVVFSAASGHHSSISKKATLENKVAFRSKALV